jgi:alkylation response protein AidB-like acyl-CoA dehydrogenase
VTDLLYSSDEEDLRASVKGMLSRHHSVADVKLMYDGQAAPGDLWSGLLQLGAVALLIPEDQGGSGAGPREAAVVLEELGRNVAAVPYLTSAVIASEVLRVAGASLKGLASGESIATLVLPWNESSTTWSPMTDLVRPVAGALDADQFLVATTGVAGLELRALPREDVVLRPLVSLDMSRPLAEVRVIGAGRLVASGQQAHDAVEYGLRMGEALLASEQVGLAAWCLASTVEHVRTRFQFARPLGSFQAIKHRLADIYIDVVRAQAAARYAADAMANDDPDAPLAAAIAQAFCSDTAVHAAEQAVQLHGGFGMTWEHDAHLYLKRAKADQLALGTPEVHRRAVGSLVNLTL